MIGSEISHYRILDELGRGGMGIVYRAEDTRLKRQVAIKVLPSQFSNDGNAASRFSHEAQAAAALNHPNIAHVYEIDEENGQPFIVMELVDGPSLKEVIAERPMDLEDAVKTSIEIASGLQVAHDNNIVHRDIKPGNIMISGRGTAKIMDFGLAKQPDMTALTQTGTALGTVAYMSPEQARGEHVDTRSDIFALGVVIYEMVTGKSPFSGVYAEAMVYSILNVDPEPLTALRTGVPMELERIVGKCLAKNVKERYQGMADLMVDLQALLKTVKDPSGSTTVSVTDTRTATTAQFKSAPNRLVGLLTAGIVLLSSILIWQMMARDSNQGPSFSSSEFFLPGHGKFPESGRSFDLSSDGTQLVMTAVVDSERNLFIKNLQEVERPEIEIEGSDNGIRPSFSPDGQWIAFVNEGSLFKIPAGGGDPISLYEGSESKRVSYSWTDTDSLLIHAGSLMMVASSGGLPREIAIQKHGDQVYYHDRPVDLPGPNKALISANNEGTWSIATLDTRTGHWEIILQDAHSPTFLPPDQMFFMRRGALWVVTLDMDLYSLAETEKLVQESVFDPNFQSTRYDVSDSGTMVFVPDPDIAPPKLVQTDYTGRILNQYPTNAPSDWLGIRSSPDQKSVAISVHGGIELINLQSGQTSYIVSRNQGSGTIPVWHPSGSWLFFTSDKDTRSGTFGVYRIAVPAGDQRVEVLDDNLYYLPASFSSDGSIMAIVEWRLDPMEANIMIAEMDGLEITEEPFYIVQTPGLDVLPTLSPDGNWIAYASAREDNFNLYVRDVAFGQNTIQVTNGDGWAPIWAPDQSAIYYTSKGAVYKVAIEFSPRLAAHSPEIMFEHEFVESTPNARNWDYVSVDSTFLFLHAPELEMIEMIRAVADWRAQVR